MASQGSIRVLIAEDQPVVRHAIASIISLQSDMTVVGETANRGEALRFARALNPDILLMDLMGPRSGGCGVIQCIRSQCPDTRVIVLTSEDADGMVFQAISSGAEAYLLKETDEQQILYTIRTVFQGNSALSPAVTRKLLDEFRRIRPAQTEDERLTEPLTKCEERVLSLVIEGKSNKAIAATVFRAEGTVKNYVSRIMEKLNVRTRTELAVKGLRQGIRTSPAPVARSREAA